MLNDKTLDKNIPIPLYFQLKMLILEEIKNGNYEIGDIIPTEEELSGIFQISRTTIRQTIKELVQEGWLYRIKSKGTFVTHPKVNQDFINKLESFNDQIIRTGGVPNTKVLFFDLVPIPKEHADKLNMQPGDKVILLKRRRFVDNIPIVYVETYLPYHKSEDVLKYDFSKKSLYDVLSQDNETRICRITRILEAVTANASDVETLNVKKGVPILFFTSTGYNENNEPIEYSLARYRSDHNQFKVEINTYRT